MCIFLLRFPGTSCFTPLFTCQFTLDGIAQLVFILANLDCRPEIFRAHRIIFVQMIIFNELYKLGRISRIGSIARFLQAVRPCLIIRYIIVEQ